MAHTYRSRSQFRWKTMLGAQVLQEWFPCLDHNCPEQPHGEWRDVPSVEED